ncbi:MAG: hypothetical protein KGD60_00240 [Candidatus Thorarchaeota archaeon]|nr:hypothetical protein [Candidatus Thorarchaeota archaeon]
MMPTDKKKTSKKSGKSKYLFKITVVGPDDSLLEDVLSTFDPVVKVDGIRIVSADHSTDDSDVRAVFMSPKHAVLDILLSLTFKSASAVIIVLRGSDPELETIYRNEIRENLGTKIPTRVVTVESALDKFKRTEIHHIFDELMEEILAQREKEHKAKEKKKKEKGEKQKEKTKKTTTKKKKKN